MINNIKMGEQKAPEKTEQKRQIKKAMILAGGLGTRFLPVTLAGAKELIAIGNKPIIMYHLEDLVKAGITDVLIVGNKLKEESFKNFICPNEEYINKIVEGGKLSLLEDYNNVMSKLTISYVNQDDRYQNYNGEMYENDMYNKMGSSVGVYAGKLWANGEPFIIINGDDLCVYDDGKSVAQELIDLYNASNGDYVMYGKEAKREDMWKYSAMKLGDKLSAKGAKMLDFVEKPAPGTEPSNIMGFARYVFNPDFFDLVKSIPPRKNGEFCMTDIYTKKAKEGKASTCLFDGNYFDCGSMEGYIGANVYMGLQNASTHDKVAETVKQILSKTSGKGFEK